MKQLSIVVTNLMLMSLVLMPLANAQTPSEPNESQRKEWAPFQISLVDPYQIFDRDTEITGMRINLLYGMNDAMWGLDLGIGNAANQVKGIQTGIFNASRETYGLQAGVVNGASRNSAVLQAGVFNGAGDDFSGIQIGVVNDTTTLASRPNKVSGFQLGALNLGFYNPYLSSRGKSPLMNTTSFRGVEIGAINAKHELRGLSIGAFNAAGYLSGVQIGVINFAEEAQGLQIGVFNFISKSKLRFFPVLNASW